MILKGISVPTLFGLAASLAGCSEIVPGLNVKPEGGSGHEYRIVRSDDGSGYTTVPGKAGVNYEIVPITGDLITTLAAAPQAAASAPAELRSITPAEVPPEYQVGPGDVLYVTVWDHPELTAAAGGQVRDFNNEGRLVLSDGSIFFPYAGTLQVKGLTVAQIRKQIADRLSGVVQNPQVDVRVVVFRSQRVQVTGEVTLPGTVALDNTPQGILEAIADRGGLTKEASRRTAYLVRGGKVYTIDLASLLSGTGPAGNVALLPGDEVHVPDQSADQVFVLGSVDKQQPLTIHEDSLSLIQALTSAGGLDVLRGSDAGILVFRRSQQSDDRKPVVFTLDLSNPGGVLLAGEFMLKPRDVVYVQATAFARYNSVVLQILPTVQAIFDSAESVYLVKHQ